MGRIIVSLDNTKKVEPGSFSNKFPNDGSLIEVSGMKRVLVYGITANGKLELVFKDVSETVVLYGDNDSVDIPVDCMGISFQLSDRDYSTAKFIFEII